MLAVSLFPAAGDGAGGNGGSIVTKILSEIGIKWDDDFSRLRGRIIRGENSCFVRALESDLLLDNICICYSRLGEDKV